MLIVQSTTTSYKVTDNTAMDKKDTTIQVKRLSNDTAFYNNVFKKTEKISSVILYVLSFSKSVSEKSLIEKLLEEKSFSLHETSLKALRSTEGDTSVLYELRQSLLETMSTLELATAARMVSDDLLHMLLEHIDVVHRYITNHYLQNDSLSIDTLKSEYIESAATTVPTTSSSSSTRPTTAPKARRAQRVTIPAGDISTDAYLVHSQLTDRAGRIKTVLEAKPQASVKDVSEIITDVSEKTIQRELNSLIEKGQVIREGERRWSRYSVVKD